MMHAPAPLAFAVAGTLLAMLIVLGAALGGAWVWAALALLAVAGPLADTLAGRLFHDAAPDRSFRGAEAVLVWLAGCTLAVLGAALIALAESHLETGERIALFLSAGMYLGQVGHAVGHELIHRNARLPFRLGAAVYTVLLFGHHVSAHRLVHHRHVATPADPNSAPRGMGFWPFAVRAWVGSFRAGLAAERRLRGHARPYLGWVLGGAGCVAAVMLLLGPRAAADYLGLAAYAQMQILLSDYVQHYGLRRTRDAQGRLEAPGPRHAWDSPHPLSSLMLVNAPHHGDHHMHPTRAYPALRLAETTPRLPYPITVMAAIALIPPLWRRVMDRRVKRHLGLSP